jgi:hypothetical protein
VVHNMSNIVSITCHMCHDTRLCPPIVHMPHPCCVERIGQQPLLYITRQKRQGKPCARSHHDAPMGLGQ